MGGGFFSNTLRMQIRAYQPSDRDALRAICCDTGNLGQPVDSNVFDRELFADYWVSPYINHEPENIWVADENGNAVGYLTAAFDTDRHHRRMRYCVMPAILLKSLFDGRVFKHMTRDFIWTRFKLWWGKSLVAENLIEAFPAHLHINIKEGFRGRAVGKELLEAFFAAARSAGVKGVHLETRADGKAPAFFEKNGFQKVGQHGPSDHAVAIYGRSLKI